MIARSVPSYPWTATSRTPGRPDRLVSKLRTASTDRNGPAEMVACECGRRVTRGARGSRGRGEQYAFVAGEQLAHRGEQAGDQLGQGRRRWWLRNRVAVAAGPGSAAAAAGRESSARGHQLRLDIAQQPVQLVEMLQGAHPFARVHGQGRSLLGGAAPDYAAAASSETASSATWVGVRPTRTPLASSASALALAVPCEPDTIAPAWPMVLPGGAVKPAM